MVNPNSLSGRIAAQLLRGIMPIKVYLKTSLIRLKSPSRPKIILVVEGLHDIEFLRRISVMLHADDRSLPDLAQMERQQELIFVPCGGGDARQWTFRLAGLGCPEFHLYDRDISPVTEARQQMVAIINGRSGCRAVLTDKRSLENYLDQDVIFEASGIHIEFSDNDNVAELVARHIYERQGGRPPWQDLPARARKRRRDKAKHWLNTRAVERMTIKRLARRDPAGEVRSWLKTINNLANGIR